MIKARKVVQSGQRKKKKKGERKIIFLLRKYNEKIRWPDSNDNTLKNPLSNEKEEVWLNVYER